uniref:Movement protein n=1 Tax=Strongyloides papillosus TaxID=174720 RepID=A0A0N5BUV9_STREA
LLIPAIGYVLKYPMAKRMIMADTSFKLVESCRSAIHIDEYRVTPTMDSEENPPIVNYGVMIPVNTVTSILSSNAEAFFPGISLTLVSTTVFPSAVKPGWTSLHIVYGGGSVAGPLPSPSADLGAS